MSTATDYQRLNNFVSLGDKLVIECAVLTKTSEVRWDFTPHSSTESPRRLATFIGQSGWTQNNVSVQLTKISSTSITVLQYTSIQLEHLGLYTCEAYNDDESTTTVEYMVSGEKHLYCCSLCERVPTLLLSNPSNGLFQQQLVL